MKTTVEKHWGLLIPNKAINYIAEHCGDYSRDDFANPKDFLYEKEEIDGVNFVFFIDTSTDFYDIEEKEIEDPDDIDDDEFVIVELERKPNIFSQAYKDFDEIVEELQNKLEKLLPPGFDYKKNLVMAKISTESEEY